MYPSCVVSGGQTGADQGGLYAAEKFGILTNGYMPKSFKTENGPNPELAKRFALLEHPSDNYNKRTEENIIISDGTICFASNMKSPGTLATIKLARKHNHPVLCVEIDGKLTNKSISEVANWIHENYIETLNIAGNRESKSPGIQQLVIDFLVEVFVELTQMEIKRLESVIYAARSH